MAGDKAALSYRLKTLGANLNTFLKPVRQRLADDMVKIAFMQKFLKNWESSMKNEQTSQEGYNNALNSLPRDNPNTPMDEGFTEANLKEKFNEIFGKPLEVANFTDAKSIENAYSQLTAVKMEGTDKPGQIRLLLAQQMSMDSNINSIQAEINTLKSILSSDDSSDE